MKSERYVFPPFTVDTRAGSVWRESAEILLRAKTFAVLCYLLERPGQLVSKDELLEQIWAGTYVDEGALTVCITELRKALGDDTKKPRFIATVTKQGYRFIGPVVSSQHSVVSRGEQSGIQSPKSGPAPNPQSLTPNFVGRSQELSVLQAALDEAMAGHGRLVLLAGEPGIGKTRMAEELANNAREQHVPVLFGRCYDGEGAPPFWPWVQIMRAYLSAQDVTTVRMAMGVGAAVIAQVIPEVHERLGDLPTPPDLAAEQARFRFFDSFTVFLKHATKSQPVVLILDDLQWADTPSLLLLQFIARELQHSQVLLIGTYRDLAFAPSHPFAQTLGELTRHAGSQTLSLAGLTESDIAQFVMLATTQTPSPSLVTAIHQKTDGNPFFMTEVVHAVAHEGDVASLESSTAEILPLPRRVRAAIEHRTATLSAPCRNLLAIAAAIGQEFPMGLLEAVHTGSEPPIERAGLFTLLNEAIAARFLVVVPRGIGQYSFAHALIRETLYAGLREDQRVLIHRQIGEALEHVAGKSADGMVVAAAGGTVAELAFHFYLAAPGGASAKALAYAMQAGDRAASLFAYSEAATQYEHALQLVELTKGDEVQRGELLLRLGGAQRKVGNTSSATETCRKIVELARDLRRHKEHEQSTSLLARAALEFSTGFVGIGAAGGIADPFIIGLLEEALTALGDEDSVLRARTLSRLALEIYYSHDTERLAALSQDAVAVARRLQDTATLGHALYARHTVRAMPEQIEERLAIATEITRLAADAGDKELAVRGQFLRLCDLLELADFQTADREFPVYQQRAEELRQPSYLWFSATWQSTRHWLRGNYPESVRYAREALTISQRAQDPDAAQCFTAQIFGTHSGMRSLQGIELPVQQFAEHYTALPAWRAALALRYAGSGAMVEAQRELDHFAADNFSSIPHDRSWLITLTNISRVCAVVSDPMRAAVLYDLLLPYAARNIVAQPAIFFLGSVCRVLGMLAATMGRWSEAEAHYEEALRQHREIHAGPLVVLTQQQYAPMFFDRNQPGDWDRAMALLDQTTRTAQELGMDESETRLLGVKNKNQERPQGLTTQSVSRPQPRLALIKGKEEQREVPAPTVKRDRPRSRRA